MKVQGLLMIKTLHLFYYTALNQILNIILLHMDNRLAFDV